jgi:competence protein ComGC
MSRVCPPLRKRRAFTLIEAVVVIGVIGLLLLISIPLIFKGLESLNRKGCQMNLQKLGKALESYQTQFNAFPTGSKFQANPDSPWGPSWWLAIAPYADISDVQKKWANNASSGSFSGDAPNSNVLLVDGLRPSIMFCPASPLPQGNRPDKDMSAANRNLIKTTAQGIPVSMYVAIAGSAPDMKGVNRGQSVSAAHGRTTKDGKYGVLSASGMFPPNSPLRAAAVTDGLANVIAIAEQSDFYTDDYYEPPVQYDLRSGWPGGAFTGAGGNYSGLSPTGTGIGSSGSERCLNITTVRYPINTKELKPGIVAQPLGPMNVPEGKPPKPAPQLPPGPGHNQGIYSCHSGGALILFGDGRVQFKADDMDLPTLQMLVTRDDGTSVEH